VRSFSTNSRPALRAASGRPPARQRRGGHRGASLTFPPGGAEAITRQATSGSHSATDDQIATTPLLPVCIAVAHRRGLHRAPQVPGRASYGAASLNITDLRDEWGRWAVGRWWWSAGPDGPGGRDQNDRLVGWSGRLRPAAMGGALDAEVAHLALDDPRVGAQPPLGDQVP
jgi:hypothetical protein